MNPDRERLYALDGLRATMMLLGVVLHTVITYVPVSIGEAWPLQDADQTIWALLTLMVIHAFRMQVFFVIAGFFAALLYERLGTRGLIKNRLNRIGVPLVVGLIVLWPLIVAAFVFATNTIGHSIEDGIRAVGEVPAIVFAIPRNTGHLWFIYHLLFFYAAVLLLSLLSAQIPGRAKQAVSGSFAWLAAKPVLRVIVLSVVSCLTLLPVGGQIDASTSFMPEIVNLIIYFVFFGFGWLLFAHRRILAGFTRGATRQTLGSVLILVVYNFVVRPNLDLPAASFAVFNSSVTALTSWMLVFGITGLFLRHFHKPSPLVRYLVDASYWVYLVHLPVVVTMSGLVANSGMNVWLKMIAVMAATTAVGFLSYDFLVRPTFIGNTLNGRRFKRGLPAAAEI